jgi:hypothetical protein
MGKNRKHQYTAKIGEAHRNRQEIFPHKIGKYYITEQKNEKKAEVRKMCLILVSITFSLSDAKFEVLVQSTQEKSTKHASNRHEKNYKTEENLSSKGK